jgi:hypothetical protein
MGRKDLDRIQRGILGDINPVTTARRAPEDSTGAEGRRRGPDEPDRESGQAGALDQSVEGGSKHDRAPSRPTRSD